MEQRGRSEIEEVQIPVYSVLYFQYWVLKEGTSNVSFHHSFLLVGLFPSLHRWSVGASPGLPRPTLVTETLLTLIVGF